MPKAYDALHCVMLGPHPMRGAQYIITSPAEKHIKR